MGWFSDNMDKLDKILTILISVIVAGVIGYFSGIIAIRGDISELSERLTKIETQRAEDRKKIDEIDSIKQGIQQLKSDVTHATKIREMTAETNQKLEAIKIFWEQRTVNELEELLHKYGEKK